jgi:PAS domain S-box-containing protein
LHKKKQSIPVLASEITADSEHNGFQNVVDNRTFLNSLLEFSTEAIICLNEAQEITLFNRGAEEIFGYSNEEVIGQPLHILLPDQFHKAHVNHVAEFISSSDQTRLMHQRRTISGRRRNGELFPAQASISKHKSEQGLILTVILRDLTEPSQFEERLLKLSVVVEQTPASVVVTDTRGRIEYVNPAFERVTGYSMEEVTGKTPSILKSGTTPAELYQSMWQTITKGEVWSGEICNRKKNGELFWELGTVSPIRNKDGAITNYISIKEDITERKKSEEELNRYRQHLEELVEARTLELREEIDEHKRTELLLREKEQSLDLALRIGKLGGWEYDFQTSNITWADEVYRIFGVDPADTRLNYQKVLGMVHPEDKAFVQQTLDTAISSHQPFNIDHRIITFDMQQRVINLSGVPVNNNLGVSTKMIGTVQDITERVQFKADLLEKERMSRELAIGREIQLSMLPKASPTVAGWQFAGFYQPAREVGGDFYDWINLPNGEIGLIIADVSDKGVPAALSMALCRAILRTNALIGKGPRATLARSNDILFHDYYNGGYVSVICASLDPRNGHIELVNAGHNYPLLYSSSTQEVRVIRDHGMVIGLFPNLTLVPVHINLMPGDVLFCYTDGLTEANNLKGEFFDEERLMNIYKENAHRPATEILGAIVKSWQDFVGKLPQADDLTLIIAKRTGM